MCSLGCMGRLLIVCSGSAMTLHVLKQYKFIEICLWFIAISLFVAFLGKICILINAKLDLLFGLLAKIDEKLKA